MQLDVCFCRRRFRRTNTTYKTVLAIGRKLIFAMIIFLSVHRVVLSLDY